MLNWFAEKPTRIIPLPLEEKGQHLARNHKIPLRGYQQQQADAGFSMLRCTRHPAKDPETLGHHSSAPIGPPWKEVPKLTGGMPTEWTWMWRCRAAARAFSSMSPPQAAVLSTSLQYCAKLSPGPSPSCRAAGAG